MESLAIAEQPRSAKYLVCVDSRPESRVALRMACMKAATRGGRVNIIHVVAPADFQTLGGIADRMREERKSEGEQLLSALAEEARNESGVVPTLILREGSAGDEILASALEDADISMIFIGIAHASSGRGKLAAWLAAQLSSKLFVPLLMVPGNLTDQQLESLI